MNQKNQMESIIIESIIDIIVDKVIEKIIDKSKRGILLFTGATIGYNEAIESISKLKMEGWEFDVVMSKSATEVLSEEDIKKSIDVEKIINDNKYDIKELLQRNSIVIVPTLTINSAAKIANCISDTLVTNIISKALMLGKPVVASINGCCPENEERKIIYGDNLSDLYKKKLSENLEALRNYNIRLSSSENLYNNVNKMLLKSFNLYKTNKNNALNKTNISNATSKYIPKSKEKLCFAKLDKKVLSRKDIWDNKKFNTIFINQNTLITDLARDEAEKLNIKLLRE
ncbi:MULTISPECIES: flavoprotein [unclassified Romboutsia]|uniref:flavoprotein n=1 Tax=unclassified Romboutsia TaxID=2626894 RepID=UPI000822A076|nr:MULTISPECIES: flavoprotein [unclassified Romboutsia]SCI25179.1 bifunctional phosphopantothenoylcysteine decarboxylase/phosphopantothenate synthase [uncultured Clostridium sp.]